jgi:hypothetical protein
LEKLTKQLAEEEQIMLFRAASEHLFPSGGGEPLVVIDGFELVLWLFGLDGG